MTTSKVVVNECKEKGNTNRLQYAIMSRTTTK